MKRAAKIYTALIFVFLFAPIVILLVFSFNEAKSLSVFSGFSLKSVSYTHLTLPTNSRV